jgi:hypothetical protein
MKVGMKYTAPMVGIVLWAVACASSNPRVVPPSGASDASAPLQAGSDGGRASVPPSAPIGRPFANDSVQATSLCNDAVDGKSSILIPCIQAARARQKQEHGKIVIEIGIDQEGTLIGVKTPKGQPSDAVLNDCVRDALAGANFPRSHAGVITVRRSFEDQPVPK